MRTEPDKEGYFVETFLPDVFVGSLALLIVFPLALLLGGFSFFEPWFIVTPPATFALGMLRGNSAGNVWLKCIGMNAAFLVVLGLCANALTFSLGALVIVLPTVGGIWLRRHRLAAQTKLDVQ
jgi:hypothetical protein